MDDMEAPADEAAEAPDPNFPSDPPTAGATLRVDTLEGAGPYLTDDSGRALYMFTADTKDAGTSACTDDCAQVWPPYLAWQGNPSAASDAVSVSMIGTLQRQDGQTQVTYDGWPLYYYAEDTGPGTAKGQDVHGHGGEWYLVRPSGEKLEAEGS